MDQETIARLLNHVAVSQELLSKTSTYIDLLLKWNSKVNLTAIRDPEEIVNRHFGESFFAAENLITPDWHDTIIDVGSGAGFPGVPMAMYAPAAKVTLVESQGKKAAFLNEVIFALKLGNAKVFNGRAEQFSGTAELVVMRAVERFDKAQVAASNLVSKGGRLALFVSSTQTTGAESLQEFDWYQRIRVPGTESRIILVGTKRVKVD